MNDGSLTASIEQLRKAGTVDMANAANVYWNIYSDCANAASQVGISEVAEALDGVMKIFDDAYQNVAQCGEILRLLADELEGIDGGTAKEIDSLASRLDEENDGPILQD